MNYSTHRAFVNAAFKVWVQVWFQWTIVAFDMKTNKNSQRFLCGTEMEYWQRPVNQL